MKWKNVISFLLLFFILFGMKTHIFAQKAEIVYKNKDYKSRQKGRFFEFIHDDFDISKLTLIAKLKGISLNTGKQNLQKIYNSFYYNANQLGANSFQIDTIIGVETDTISIIISVYKISKEERKNNSNLFSGHSIIIIGGLIKDEQSLSFKVNDEKAKISTLEYLEYPLDKEGELKISVGSILGATTTFKDYPERKPTYISLHGVGVGSGNYGATSISVNTGRIYPVDMSFGYFLIQALKKGNIE